MTDSFSNAPSPAAGGGADAPLGSPEAIADSRLTASAQGLARRAAMHQATQATSDQDIADGVSDPNVAATEQALQAVQQKLHRSTSPVEQAQLAAQAEQLAGQLVAAEQSGEVPAVEAELGQIDSEDIGQALRAEFGDEKVNSVLASAAENLSPDAAKYFNAVFESGNDADISTAFTALKDIQGNPEIVTSQPTALDQSQIGDFVEAYGEQTAYKIQDLNIGLVQGTYTQAQAVKKAMVDPELRQALMDAARRGQLKLNMG